jgi:hypothetical protein
MFNKVIKILKCLLPIVISERARRMKEKPTRTAEIKLSNHAKLFWLSEWCDYPRIMSYRHCFTQSALLQPIISKVKCIFFIDEKEFGKSKHCNVFFPLLNWRETEKIIIKANATSTESGWKFLLTAFSS